MKFDVIIWGATSFVGQYLSERILQQYGEKLKGRIAFAGRDLQKLQSLNQKLNSDVTLLVGDANDECFVFELVEQTKVVVSTVGPYALYGENMVKACAELGRDYCDLTGEPQWIRLMLERYEAIAKQNHARIIHSCGFDSIPSDMGVFFLQSKCLELYDEPCAEIRYQYRKSKGGISGGTYASLLNAIESIRTNPDEAKRFKTPYALIVDKPSNLPYQRSVSGLTKDTVTSGYLAPFVMSSINTKIVHRSNYLLDYQWGKSFLYDESMYMGRGAKGLFNGLTLSIGLAGFLLLAAFGPTRNLLKKWVVPAPGEGPNDELVRHGYFNVKLFGTTKSGKKVEAMVSGKGDPGYGSTSKMLTEVALLLLAMDKTETGTGFLTPSVAFKSKGLAKLEAEADFEFAFQERTK